MARTALTVQQLSGPFPGSFNLDAITFTAADVANGNSFVLTGKELIIATNVAATTQHNITLTSVADPFRRTGNVTLAIDAGAYAVFQASELTGWIQSDGKFYLSADNAEVEFAIIRLK